MNAHTFTLKHKRNILNYLVAQYLLEEDLGNTLKHFVKETRVDDTYEVCDNISLGNILEDYTAYYHTRFGKYPKIVKKSSTQIGSKFNISAAKEVVTSSSQSTANILGHNNQRNYLSEENDVSCVYRKGNITTRQHYEKQSDESIYKNPFQVSVTSLTKPSKLECEVETVEIGSSCSVSFPLTQSCPFISPVYWTDIIGLDHAKSILKEAVIYPQKYPKMFSGRVVPWKGVLLYGPPGTGKTLLARGLATEANVNFFNISASTIISKWRGESEKMVRSLFDEARSSSPCIIFIDEIDAITCHRDGAGDHEASRRLTAEFLVQLDGITTVNAQVVLLAATNIPWCIDIAVLRRLEKRIYIELPDFKDRRDIIQFYLPPTVNQDPLILTEMDYDRLAEDCKGFSAADIKIACKEVIMQSIRHVLQRLDLETKDKSNRNIDGVYVINTDDAKIGFAKIKPSVLHLAEKYNKWKNEFGTE